MAIRITSRALLRKPSVALALRNFGNDSLNPALKALDQGLNGRTAELFFGGLQGDPDAYNKCPEQVKSMMLANKVRARRHKDRHTDTH